MPRFSEQPRVQAPLPNPSCAPATAKSPRSGSTFDLGGDTFDNATFDALEELGDVAKRFPDNDAIKAEGGRLADLAEGDGGFIVTVSAFEVERNSANISARCR